MLRVGLVGIGFMGWIHYLAYQKAKGVQLAAVCTRDRTRLAGDWRGIQGNFGPPGEAVDLSDVAKYSTLPALLADKSIDLVDLCLPPHLHAEGSIAALKAGKHVFVEKPMGLTAAECDKMVAAEKTAKKQTLARHRLPFLPEYAFAWKVIESGKHCKLLGVHFKRNSTHTRVLTYFFNPDKVCVTLVDLHDHDANFI